MCTDCLRGKAKASVRVMFDWSPQFDEWLASPERRFVCKFGTSGDQEHEVLLLRPVADMKVTVVWRCFLPVSEIQYLRNPANADVEGKICTRFRIHAAANPDDNIVLRACHKPQLQPKAPYRFAMCLQNPTDKLGFHMSNIGGKKANVDAFALTIQWLEYHAMHGAEHFWLYVPRPDLARMRRMLRPYVRTGLLSFVVLEGRQVPGRYPRFLEWGGAEREATEWYINDCINRFRYYSVWLTANVEIDEYITPLKGWDPNGSHWGDAVFPRDGGSSQHGTFVGSVGGPTQLIPDLFERYLRRVTPAPLHGLLLSQLAFLMPDSPYTQLQVASKWRLPEVNPNTNYKWALRPLLVDSMWSHGPTRFANGTSSKWPYEDPPYVNFHHYRLSDRATASLEDGSLQRESSAMWRAICLRYARRWSAQRACPELAEFERY